MTLKLNNMDKKDFFVDQKDSTAIKLNFYCNYIESYLITVLMQFGTCLICDFFCGPGKNGNEKGSPLMLIDIANKILGNETLKKKYSNPRITILFNDQNEEYIENLKNEITKIQVDKHIKLFIAKQNFSEIMRSEIINILRSSGTPKFIFLDPFNYSTIQLKELKILMDLSFTEVLFFSPTFHAYRFKKIADKYPRLKKFLDEFTSKGVTDYKDLYDFVESICTRLKSEIKSDFVRPIVIDYGKSKYTLFYISKHIKGMMIINRIFLKESFDGKCLCVKEVKILQQKPALFKKSQIETVEFKNRVRAYQEKLLNEIKNKKKLTNTYIIHHSVMYGLLPQYARELIDKLKKESKVEYEYLTSFKTRGPYISEQHWNDAFCVIHYKVV